NAKAAMWLPIWPMDVGGDEIKAIDPMESESPKTRSASASILGRGRLSLRSISGQEGILRIWSFATGSGRQTAKKTRRVVLRKNNKRALKRMDTPILKGYQLYHNFVSPHVGLKGATPASKAGITVEGENK